MHLHSKRITNTIVNRFPASSPLSLVPTVASQTPSASAPAVVPPLRTLSSLARPSDANRLRFPVR